MNRKYLGTDGEFSAHDYLLGQGYEILAMNYRRPTGEIDLIARRGGTMAFVEVKRRSSRTYARPAEAVNRQKQARIARTASLFLQERGLDDVSVRFDIIEITPGDLRHTEAAFDATGLL